MLQGVRVVDLFAGCGGLSYGFHKPNWKVYAYEMWDDACKVYRKNHPNTDVFNRALNMNSELQPMDVLIGGPPCQPFSVGGNQRGQYDKRDMVPFFVKTMQVHKPQIAIMENVENLTGDKHKDYLTQVLSDIRNLGYTVDWRVVNTVDYGVPQQRKRLIIVAHRGGFQFPQPTTKHNPVSVGATLPASSFSAKTATQHPSLVLTPAMDEYIARYEAKSKCINPRDLSADRPARTLTCRNLAGATSDMIRIKLDDGKRRQLTVEEAAMLQTFPVDYFLGINRSKAMKMIGNSVPPRFSEVLAQAVSDYLVVCTPDNNCKQAHNREEEEGDVIQARIKHKRKYVLADSDDEQPAACPTISVAVTSTSVKKGRVQQTTIGAYFKLSVK